MIPGHPIAFALQSSASTFRPSRPPHWLYNIYLPGILYAYLSIWGDIRLLCAVSHIKWLYVCMYWVWCNTCMVLLILQCRTKRYPACHVWNWPTPLPNSGGAYLIWFNSYWHVERNVFMHCWCWVWLGVVSVSMSQSHVLFALSSRPMTARGKDLS